MKPVAAKRILFLATRAPYVSAQPLEALEAMLVAAVFDQKVSVLFKGAGLYQLLEGQKGSALGQRTLGKALQALPEYDVRQLFACRESARRLGLTDADFCMPILWLDCAEQRALIARQDAVVSG